MRLAILLAIGLLPASIWTARSVAAESSGLSEIPLHPVTEAQMRKKAALTAEAARAEHTSRRKHEIDRYTEHGPKLSETPLPMLRKDEQPEPTPPVYEWGEKFLHPGPIAPGFTIPTGAVWQPALWIFGNYFATAGFANSGVGRTSGYISNRLDLTFNLKFTPTERVVLGISPLSLNGDNTGFLFQDGSKPKFENAIGANVQALFFEGDFGEIFPRLDPNDNKGYDYGFAVGRQPALFQGGIMLNAPIDGISVTRDTIMIPGVTPDMRVSALVGHADRRSDRQTDNTAYMAGLFTETDLRVSTIDIDAAYLSSNSTRGGDTFNFGTSAVQRFGPISTTFRVNTSTALENTGPAAGSGVLLTAETATTLPSTDDILYVNAFDALGSYTSVARGEFGGGPLSGIGFLFASPVAGLVGSPLSNTAKDVAGGAIGYQHFIDDNKSQLIFELAGRKDTNNSGQGMVALGGEYLHALDNRTSIQFSAFVSDGENRQVGYGGNILWRLRL
jgi:hypothetical protein